MSAFGEDLIRSLNEALAHAKGEGPAVPHAPAAPREVQKREKLTVPGFHVRPPAWRRFLEKSEHPHPALPLEGFLCEIRH